MRLEKFTEKAQEALQEAAALARSLRQQAIEPEHLILALISQEGGVGRTLLERAGVSVQALEPALVSVVERLPWGGGAPGSRVETRRPVVKSRCGPAAPRTTPSSSASPASARPPSPKGSPSGSPPATCPKA